jgi:hypothetical protein
VYGPSELSEIRVFDTGLREVAMKSESVSVDLSPGIYRVQVRMPGDTTERLVLVEPGESTLVQNIEFRADSPAPIHQAKTHHEFQEGPAYQLSRQVMRTVGNGPHARLFVFVRTEGGAGARPPRMTLRDPKGQELAKLPEVGEVNIQGGWAALTVDLPTGTYVLEQELPGLGLRGQAVFAERGWETQVFVPWDEPPDLAGASVFMKRYGVGFQPGDWEYLKTAAALDGLADGRLRLHPSDMDLFLHGKFENPMLGLIGAYALVLQGKVDWNRLSIVARNLRRLLPHSPDVAVIRLLSHARGEWPPPRPEGGWPSFKDPPMFEVGMDALIAMATEAAELIDPGSRVARIAPVMTSGSAWTRWEAGLTEEEVSGWVRAELDDLRTDPETMPGSAEARASGLPLSVVEQAFRTDAYRS